MAYILCKSLLGDEKDLMHKAMGWLFCKAHKADTARLEKLQILYQKDIGQTDMYVRMFENRFKVARDNPTIRIILRSEKLVKIFFLTY